MQISMVNKVPWLDEAFQAVRLEPGSIELGKMKGNIDRPTVLMMPTLAIDEPAKTNVSRRPRMPRLGGALGTALLVPAVHGNRVFFRRQLARALASMVIGCDAEALARRFGCVWGCCSDGGDGAAHGESLSHGGAHAPSSLLTWHTDLAGVRTLPGPLVGL